MSAQNYERLIEKLSSPIANVRNRAAKTLLDKLQKNLVNPKSFLTQHHQAVGSILKSLNQFQLSMEEQEIENFLNILIRFSSFSKKILKDYGVIEFMFHFSKFLEQKKMRNGLELVDGLLKNLLSGKQFIKNDIANKILNSKSKYSNSQKSQANYKNTAFNKNISNRFFIILIKR